MHDGRADRETLRRFVDDAPVALAMLDADLRYLAASPRWIADYGLEAATYRGSRHYDLFPELPDHWKSVHARCLAGAVEECPGEPFLRADGRRQWVRWAVHPWRDESGGIGGLLMFAEDITARMDAEAALNASDEVRRLALDAANAGVWSYDARTHATTWDDRSRALFGLSAAQRPSFEVWVARLHTEDRGDVLARLDTALATPGNDEWNIEFRVVWPDGTVRWIHGLGRVERADDGTALRATGINLDITARKTLEASLRLSREHEEEAAAGIRLLLQTASQGIVFVDDRGVMETVNDAVEHLFGWAAHELVGRSIDLLLPAAHREAHAQHRTAYFATPRARPMGQGLDLVAQRKDGSTFPAEVSLNHVMTPSGPRAVAFVTDISGRKAAERARRESHTALESYSRELERRTERLRALAAELTVAEQHAREQLAKTLHDGLQQVLFSSRLKVERLRTRLAAGTDVTDLITGLEEELDDAISQARSLAVELFPATLHAQGLAAGLRWLADWMDTKYGLTVALTVDDAADPGRRDVRTLVFESVRELLFNVVKHAGVRRVTVDLARADDGAVRIVVTDGGVGFDPQAAFAAHAPHQGLGLFGIRERLTLLGGTLDVRSAPGAGATFTLRAPAGATAAGAAVAREASAIARTASAGVTQAATRPLRILLADDHALVRDGLRELFTGSPQLEVVGEAADGLQALEQAHALAPDVIVMDVSMPRMDGIEATRRLRAELPAVMIFGLSTEERTDALHAIEAAGADGYFTKSDDAQLLLARLVAVHATGAHEAGATPPPPSGTR